MILKKNKRTEFQAGQTLIETLVASLILTMGITAALGLATYSLGAVGNIKQQTIAMGLAREGVEVVKNMRDTNWLRATITSDCYNFATGGSNTFCYQDWLNTPEGYNIDSGPVSTYILNFDDTQALPWSLTPEDDNFGLNLAVSSKTGDGVYYFPAPDLAVTNSEYSRKITISQSTFPPFEQRSTGPRVKVTSTVWWSGKGCELDKLGNPKSCFVTLETYLTNWRVF